MSCWLNCLLKTSNWLNAKAKVEVESRQMMRTLSTFFLIPATGTIITRNHHPGLYVWLWTRLASIHQHFGREAFQMPFLLMYWNPQFDVDSPLKGKINVSKVQLKLKFLFVGCDFLSFSFVWFESRLKSHDNWADFLYNRGQEVTWSAKVSGNVF